MKRIRDDTRQPISKRASDAVAKVLRDTARSKGAKTAAGLALTQRRALK